MESIERIATRAAEMEMETAEGMLSPPALGLHFTPSPQELLCYLFLKVGGSQLHPPLSLLGIREKLLYGDQAPWEVFQVTPSSPSRDFYCFSLVKKKSERGTGDRFSRVVPTKGAWKATLSPKPIFDEEYSDSDSDSPPLIGYHRTLNFTPLADPADKSLQLKKKRKSSPCNWIMHEYTLANYPQPAAQLWVICKICYTPPPDHSHQHKRGRGRPLLHPIPTDDAAAAAGAQLFESWAALAPLVSLSPPTSHHSTWDSHLPFSESSPTSTITESTWASQAPSLPPSHNICSAPLHTSDPSCSTTQSFRALDDGSDAQPIAFPTQQWDQHQAPPCHPPVSVSVSEHHHIDVPWPQPCTFAPVDDHAYNDAYRHDDAVATQQSCDHDQAPPCHPPVSVSEHHDIDVPWPQPYTFAPVDDHGYNDACRHDDAVATQQWDDHPPVPEHYDMDLLFAHVDVHGHGDAYQHEDAVDFNRWISSLDVG